MPQKDENQVVSQLQDYVACWRLLIDFLEGPMEIQLENIEDEILTGESNYITDFQMQALRSFRSQLNNLYLSSIPFFASVSPTLSELAGNPNPGNDVSADIAWLHDYMTDNSKAVKSRGFTKAAWSPDGSNTGDGRVVQLKTDINSLDIDCAHPDASLRLRCIQSAGRGVTEGQEPFELIGSKVNRIWEDTGLGQGEYRPDLGKGFNDLSGDQLRIRGAGLGVQSLVSMSGGSPLNLLTNGSFEAAVSGASDSRFSGMTIISGGTNLSVESTAPLVGGQSLKVDGNFVAYMLLNEDALYPKSAISFGALVKKVISSSTLTGMLTFILRSGGDKGTAAQGTAHSTITVTVGSLTDNTTTPQDAQLIVPASLGKDPRIEITMTSYSDGSGTSNSLLIDEIYAARMYQVDMGQFILPVRGETPWETDDFFTSSVSEANNPPDRGIVQEFMNRVFGRYVKHATSATTFTDPTIEPEIGITYNGSNVADGGGIALGSVASGSHTVTIIVSNTGIYPLSFGLPARSAETNISAVDDGMTIPVVIMPGRSYEIEIEVTDGGAGAFSTTLTWDTNDSSEATYAITISGTAT